MVAAGICHMKACQIGSSGIKNETSSLYGMRPNYCVLSMLSERSESQSPHFRLQHEVQDDLS